MSDETAQGWRSIPEMQLEEMDDEISVLEAQIAPIQARIQQLKMSRRGRRAAAVSAAIRAAKVPAKTVKDRRAEIPGSRGHVPILAEEFGRSERTINRKLGPRKPYSPWDD